MNLKRVSIFLSMLLIMAIGHSCCCGQAESPREKINFDFSWQFTKGDFPEAKAPQFDDSKWQTLDVPHDWDISGNFDKKNSSGNAAAYAEGGVGWYRKKFMLDGIDPASEVSIEFGGVYMNSEVWINGKYLGKRPYGYTSFNYDLTPYLNFEGENTIAVRVDNTNQPSTRWYTGSGIYRHVWLVVTDKLSVPRHGIYTYTEKVENNVATVKVNTTIQNKYGTDKSFELKSEIVNAKGAVVASSQKPYTLKRGSEMEYEESLTVNNPLLWSPDEPNLYTLVTTISEDGEVKDIVETTIGIRTFTFRVEDGFTLNGVNMKLMGVNNHSDLGSLGAAINSQVMERRLQILKDMGCNAIRTAHNPPSEELLDMCDKMGFMVMDEAFDEWLESWPFSGVKPPKGKARYGYHLYFDDWSKIDLAELIKRDRNHPSIVLWSVGNEIPDACFEIGAERLKVLMDVVRDLDTTRPITCGITHMHLANDSGFADVLDVVGYNGGGGSAFAYEKDHETYPDRIMVATEVPHSYQTRGVYRTKSSYRSRNALGGIMEVPDYTEEEVFTQFSKYHSSSYDNAMVRIGAIDSWKRTSEFPYMSGEFRWTGYDYLGESMHGWPAKYWNFGIIDMCGFPKDTYYFYKSQWNPEPMVHILPHWTWEGLDGVEIPVMAYTNCESVELFLNGKSLGEKPMTDALYIRWDVPYERGTLVAKGKNGGKVVSEMTIVSADKPQQIEMLADKKVMGSTTHDVVHLEVNILDKDGNFVPDAMNRVNFAIDGDATILGIDNGDPINEDSFVGNTVKAFNGKCLVIVRSNGNKGKFTVTATSDGLESAKVSVTMK